MELLSTHEKNFFALFGYKSLIVTSVSATVLADARPSVINLESPYFLYSETEPSFLNVLHVYFFVFRISKVIKKSRLLVCTVSLVVLQKQCTLQLDQLCIGCLLNFTGRTQVLGSTTAARRRECCFSTWSEETVYLYITFLAVGFSWPSQLFLSSSTIFIENELTSNFSKNADFSKEVQCFWKLEYFLAVCSKAGYSTCDSARVMK